MTTNPATMREARRYEAAVEAGTAPPSIDLSPHHVTPMTLARRPLRFKAPVNQPVFVPPKSLCLMPKEGSDVRCTRSLGHSGKHIACSSNEAWEVQS